MKIRTSLLIALAFGVFALAALIINANAADLGSTKDRPAAVWQEVPAPTGIASGLYVGGSLGYGIGTQELNYSQTDGETTNSANLSSFSGEDVTFGVLGGYEQCFGRICAGVLGMYDWLKADTELSVNGDTVLSSGVENLWTIGGTLGGKIGTGELFGVIGYSGAEWSARGGDEKITKDLEGWTFGIGGKQQIAGGLEAFLLYTYTDLDKIAFENEGSRLTIDPDLHVVKAGLVYKFGVDDIRNRF